MLRLRSSNLLSSPATFPGLPLHRFLSAASLAVPPNPSFAVEDYLVATCGLTRAQALKASGELAHVKSPTNPDAVLAFLAGLGLSGPDVAALVAKDPKFLCAGMERTLTPILGGLTHLGLSRSEIGRLVSLAPETFRRTSVISNIPYYLSLFGSYDNVLRAVKRRHYLLSLNLENTVKPTVAYLQERGLGACDIANLFIDEPRVVGTKPERLQVMLACAEGLGVPRGSAMFRQVLRAVAFLSEEKIAAKVEFFKSTFRWSVAEVGIAVSKHPLLLRRSKDTLQSRSEFLISELGLEPAYIAHRPAILSYSLEGRVKPRYYVVKFLKANGLLDHDRDYYSAVKLAEKVFVEKFISPHKETAPHLAQDYEACCRGEVPARFNFV